MRYFFMKLVSQKQEIKTVNYTGQLDSNIKATSSLQTLKILLIHSCCFLSIFFFFKDKMLLMFEIKYEVDFLKYINKNIQICQVECSNQDYNHIFASRVYYGSLVQGSFYRV